MSEHDQSRPSFRFACQIPRRHIIQMEMWLVQFPPLQIPPVSCLREYILSASFWHNRAIQSMRVNTI